MLSSVTFYLIDYEVYLVLGELSKILCTPLSTEWRINLKDAGLSVSDVEMYRMLPFRRINNRVVNRDEMTEARLAMVT